MKDSSTVYKCKGNASADYCLIENGVNVKFLSFLDSRIHHTRLRSIQIKKNSHLRTIVTFQLKNHINQIHQDRKKSPKTCQKNCNNSYKKKENYLNWNMEDPQLRPTKYNGRSRVVAMRTKTRMYLSRAQITHSDIPPNGNIGE